LKRTVKHTIIAAAVGALFGAALVFTLFAVSRGRFFEGLFGLRFEPTLRAGDLAADASDAEHTAASYEILEYIKDEDYGALSAVAHPELGVVFAPYAMFEFASSKGFTPLEIAGFRTDATAYIWGVYDGTGEPIELTPAEYFKRFVFDRDFTRAQELGVNYVVKSGNAKESLVTDFPQVRFIEFHIPEDSKSIEGGWSSLRLGFEEYKGSLMLTMLVHSEWTV
jgi:hypothetical protein